MTLLITPDDLDDLFQYIADNFFGCDEMLQQAIDSLDSPEQQRRIRLWLATQESIIPDDINFLTNFSAVRQEISSAWQRSAN